MFRPLTRLQHTIDVVLASAFALFVIVLTIVPWSSLQAQSTRLGPHATVAVVVVLTLAFSGALAIRRWSPGLALAICWAAAIVQMLCGLPPLPANLAIYGVLYVTAAYGTTAVFWLGFSSAFTGSLAITLYLLVPLFGDFSGQEVEQMASRVAVGTVMFIAAMFAFLLAWTTGALVRTAIRARDNRQAQMLAEASAAAETERTRIARDMHDVVAHSLAVVIAQADGARYAAAADPAAAATALGTISTTARSALSDVRMLLTQLRHTQAEGPQPTIADLEQLYAQVRAAGVELRVDVDPAPRGEQPASLQLAVYRILQEALTNALRHGARGPVTVALAWHDDHVDLRIVNTIALPTAAPAAPHAPAAAALAETAAAAEPSRGHGLIGMRERALLVGGKLHAAPDGRGLFVVYAQLPTRSAA